MKRSRQFLVALVLATVFVIGCSDDGDVGSAVSSILGEGDGTAAAQTTPDTTAAPTTAAPTTAAPTTTAPTEDGGDDIDWLPIVLIAAGALVVIALIAAVLSRRRVTQVQHSQRQRELATYHANVINNLAWMVDVVTPRVTNRSYDPNDARELAFWGDARGRLTHLRASMTSALEQDRSPDSTAAVNRALLALDALVGAVEDDRNLRSTATPDPEHPSAFESSLQLVSQRREELRSATDALRFAWGAQ